MKDIKDFIGKECSEITYYNTGAMKDLGKFIFTNNMSGVLLCHVMSDSQILLKRDNSHSILTFSDEQDNKVAHSSNSNGMKREFKVGDKVRFNQSVIDLISLVSPSLKYRRVKERTVCGIYEDGTYKLDVELISGIGVHESWLDLAEIESPTEEVEKEE